MEIDKKKVIAIVIAVVLVIGAIVYGIRKYIEKKENEFMINDGKAGITAEVIERVPGIRYTDDVTHRKGYKIIENSGNFYIYISDGPKGVEEDTIDVKQIRIKENDVTIIVSPDYTGNSDDKDHGCVDIGVKLNKKPEHLTIKNTTEDEYSEIKILNVTDKVYWKLLKKEVFSGSDVKKIIADIINDLKKNEDNDIPEIMIQCSGMGAMRVSGMEKIRSKIFDNDKYKVSIGIQKGSESINFEQLKN